jgi:hypothetical protein
MSCLENMFLELGQVQFWGFYAYFQDGRRPQIVANWTVNTLAATIFFLSYSPLAYMIWGSRASTSSISGFLPTTQFPRCPPGPKYLQIGPLAL